MSESAVMLGVLVRVDAAAYHAVQGRLARLPGVSSFSVGETGRMGILVESDSLDRAHAFLKSEIETLPGVLGAWPVFCHADEGSMPEPRTQQTTRHFSHLLEADVDGQHTS